MNKNLANTVSAFDAKTHFSRLLTKVAAGEKITILKHNTPVAMLVPIDTRQKRDIQEVIENLTAFRRGKLLSGLSIIDLISEGRK